MNFKLFTFFGINITAYKIYIMLQVLLQWLLSPVLPWLGKLGNIAIVLWGGIILLYDVLHEKRLIKVGLKLPESLFLAAVALSILVNFRVNLLDNFEIYLILLIQFLILIPPYHGDSSSLNRSCSYSVNGLSSILFLCSLTSFILYCIDLPLYKYSYRFCGVFQNPNQASVMYFWGILSSTVALTFSTRKHLPLYRSFHILNIVLCFFMFTLANSNTGRVMLVLCVATVLFFVLFLRLPLKKWIARFACCAVLCLTAGVLSLASYGAVQKGLSYIPGAIASIASNADSKSSGDTTVPQKNFDRSESGLTADNNRFEIWREAFVAYRHKPVLGCSPRNVSPFIDTYVDKPRSEIKDGGLHNMYLELLVACGTVGFLTFMIFLVKRGVPVIQTLFRTPPRELRGEQLRLILLAAGIAAFLGMNMTESSMLFSNSPYAMCFWVLAGFAFSYVKILQKGGTSK